MKWSHAQAAAVMGMPEHEILAVAEVGDAHVVTTHDGQHTIVTADGMARALRAGATKEELAALGLDEDAVAELKAAAEGADPLTADPLAAQQAGLDPNASEIAQGAQAAHENPGGTPPGPVPVPNPEAGGLPNPADGDGDQGDGGQGDGGQGDDEQVPDGNADAVLDWVGDDAARAARALAVEGDREKPRSGLVTALQKKVGDQA
ncbi:hypothetical protein [Amycolatopsis sp. cmx-4-68]|uniref:hypothetical protein n=1 Tax=Amycolatopsis sp. cmx-4-68 TaxID=2790938 RepID=UPI0039797D29